jgi:hypothetical protein
MDALFIVLWLVGALLSIMIVATAMMHLLIRLIGSVCEALDAIIDGGINGNHD